MNSRISVLIFVAYFCSIKPGFTSSIPVTQPDGQYDYNEDDGRLCSQEFEYFHKETQMCYLIRPFNQGPCGGNMTLYPTRNSQYATCKCADIFSCGPKRLIYDVGGNRCVNSFEQGPCGEDEWLVPNGDHGSKCELNPCKSWVSTEEKKSLESFTFAHNGSCYQSHTQGFCDPYYFIVYWVSSESEPGCVNTIQKCGLSTSAYTKCTNGQDRDQFGGCSPRVREDDYE